RDERGAGHGRRPARRGPGRCARRGVRAARGEDGGHGHRQCAQGDAPARAREDARRRGGAGGTERRGCRGGRVLPCAAVATSEGGARVISFLEGEVVEKFGDRVTISVGGCGYDVLVPATTLAALPPVGKKARVLTRLPVRGDALA